MMTSSLQRNLQRVVKIERVSSNEIKISRQEMNIAVFLSMKLEGGGIGPVKPVCMVFSDDSSLSRFG